MVHVSGWEIDSRRKITVIPIALPAKATFANRKNNKKYWKLLKQYLNT